MIKKVTLCLFFFLSVLQGKIIRETHITEATDNVVMVGDDMCVARGYSLSVFRVETRTMTEWQDFRSIFFPTLFLELRKRYGKKPNSGTEKIHDGKSGRLVFWSKVGPRSVMAAHQQIFDRFFELLIRTTKKTFISFLETDGEKIQEDDIKITIWSSFCIYREEGGHHYYHTHSGSQVNWVAVWYLSVPPNKNQSNRLWVQDFVQEQELALHADEADLLIHPGWLSHGTEEMNLHGGLRSVWATNLQVTFDRPDLWNRLKLRKKNYDRHTKAQILHPFSIYIFQYFASPGTILSNYIEKSPREWDTLNDENVLQWVKKVVAIGVAETNKIKLQEREKDKTHFSHSFGDCFLETYFSQIEDNVKEIQGKKFQNTYPYKHSPNNAELLHGFRVNSNTTINIPERYLLFYFPPACQDIRMTIHGKLLRSKTKFQENSKHFDFTFNELLGKSIHVEAKGGESVIIPYNIYKRVDLGVNEGCTVLNFRAQVEHIPSHCHLV